ncbi:MAG: hypothetical protein VX520_02285, partial [Planctomycetota bacterium]|nr:hypothetical protein [Planctomycetota bacterium]
ANRVLAVEGIRWESQLNEARVIPADSPKRMGFLHETSPSHSPPKKPQTPMWKTPEARSKHAKPREILRTASSRDEGAAGVDSRRRAWRCETRMLKIDFENAMPNLVKAWGRTPEVR